MLARRGFASSQLHGIVLFIVVLATVALPVQAQVFSTPENISGNAGFSGFAQVAVDQNGNINIVWEDNTPGLSEIFFSRSSDGGTTFSSPKNVSANSGFSSFPQLALDTSNNIYVVWQGATPDNIDIFFSRSTNGGATFSTPKNISNSSAFSTRRQQLAVDSNGNINVVWHDFISVGNFDVFFSRSTDGGNTFTTPKNVSANAGLSLSPQLAADGSKIYIAWEDTSAGNLEVFFSASMDGGANFSTQNLSSNVGFSDRPQLALESGGSLNVVWKDTTPGNGEILFSRSTDGGATFSVAVNISSNAGFSDDPRLAIDGSGNINVVWEDSTPPGDFDILFSRSTDGGATFSTPNNLSNNSGLSAFPRLALDSSGNINVVWNDNTPGAPDIFFSRSTNGGNTFSAPQNLSANDGFSVEPQLAVDASGNISVVWHDTITVPSEPDVLFTRGVVLVSPAEAIQTLIGEVVALNLKQGIMNSVDGKLDAALRALNDVNQNNNVAAINALDAFINAVQAQLGISISAADAEAVIVAAEHIIALLGGS